MGATTCKSVWAGTALETPAGNQYKSPWLDDLNMMRCIHATFTHHHATTRQKLFKFVTRVRGRPVQLKREDKDRMRESGKLQCKGRNTYVSNAGYDVKSWVRSNINIAQEWSKQSSCPIHIPCVWNQIDHLFMKYSCLKFELASFPSMSTGPPITEIQLFQNLT